MFLRLNYAFNSTYGAFPTLTPPSNDVFGGMWWTEKGQTEVHYNASISSSECGVNGCFCQMVKNATEMEGALHRREIM